MPSAHPYLLLNYQGRTRDVMTLAHELGHVKHRDILLGSLAAVLAQAIMFLSQMAYYFTPRGDDDEGSNPIAVPSR